MPLGWSEVARALSEDGLAVVTRGAWAGSMLMAAREKPHRGSAHRILTGRKDGGGVQCRWEARWPVAWWQRRSRGRAGRSEVVV